MIDYGVQRLILLNSGNYLHASIDLHHSVHLAASNNRGKSTLVNSLQFLYIAEEKKMRFGKRSLEDSRKHYFGQQRSYIIYECRTPTGPQCMIVRGRSSLNGNRYERYLVEGDYCEADFLDENRTILDFEEVQGRLADRHLARIKPSELWNVLAAFCPNSSGPSATRLGLLPIKTRDQYLAFSDIFVRLLSLQDTDARTLRQLVIQSHAGDIQERRIDVAGEYSEEFARAERAEHELAFVRSASPLIQEGIKLRQRKDEIQQQLETMAPVVLREARTCQAHFGDKSVRLKTEIKTNDDDKNAADEAYGNSLRSEGEGKATFGQAKEQWEELQTKHEKWNSTSQEFVKQMRRTEQAIVRDIIQQKTELEQAEQFDIKALNRSAAELSQKIARNEAYIAQAEKTFLAHLQSQGVAREDIENVFRLGNVDALKLVVDESVVLHDAKGIAERIEAIATRIVDSVYEDDCVRIELQKLASDQFDTLFDLDALRSELKVDHERLRSEESRLATARDQFAARERLEKLKREHKAKKDDLDEYDKYASQWQTHESLLEKLDLARSEFEKAKQTVAENKLLLDEFTKRANVLEGQISDLVDQQRKLNESVVNFNNQIGAARIALTVNHETQIGSRKEEADASSLFGERTRQICKQLSGLAKQVGEYQTNRQALTELERKIVDCSRETGSMPRYFNEPEGDWNELIEEYLAREQMESAATSAWESLFKMLGARMNGIVVGIERIKRAVERIKRGLKAYQVSNLAAVEISLQEVSDTYTAVEALAAADSLFNDPELVQQAKKRLRRMIDAAEMIEIESLFELEISIQETSGMWRRAGSLDEIGSTGTGMTVKAMIFIQLIRAIAADKRYRMHFYIDGLGELDDDNLRATAELAVSEGIIPITADPRLHMEPLAHPSVTVYSLGQYPVDHESKGKFYIDATRSYHAEKIAALVKIGEADA